MKLGYIENGRFDKAIWLNTQDDDFLAQYSNEKALSVGKALEMWQGLTKALIQAGQEGTLDAGMQEYTTENNKPLMRQRQATPAMYEALKVAKQWFEEMNAWIPLHGKTYSDIEKALAKANGEKP